METLSRYKGALLGLAAGDALGTTLEFCSPGSDDFTPVSDIVGGGPFDLKAGQWTDDTAMALCLAESLIECGRFEAKDQLSRYVDWFRRGMHSCTGSCFDIGRTVCEALLRFEETQQPYCGSTDPMSAGNGSLMRLAPIPLFFVRDCRKAIQLAGDSSRTTHSSAAAVDACRFFSGLIVGTLNAAPKEELLASRYCPIEDYWKSNPLVAEIDEIAAGSFKHRMPPQIQGTGYVVRSLEAALWAFYHSTSFEDGVLLAVNLGDDADTTGAIYGQLAGAFYGEESIPLQWRNILAKRALIESYATKLYSLRK